jgi:hypothetical protein
MPASPAHVRPHPAAVLAERWGTLARWAVSLQARSVRLVLSIESQAPTGGARAVEGSKQVHTRYNGSRAKTRNGLRVFSVDWRSK